MYNFIHHLHTREGLLLLLHWLLNHQEIQQRIYLRDITSAIHPPQIIMLQLLHLDKCTTLPLRLLHFYIPIHPHHQFHVYRDLQLGIVQVQRPPVAEAVVLRDLLLRMLQEVYMAADIIMEGAMLVQFRRIALGKGVIRVVKGIRKRDGHLSNNGETFNAYPGDRRSKPSQALDDLLGGR